jgi:FkbM family methyltransferase
MSDLVQRTRNRLKRIRKRLSGRLSQFIRYHVTWPVVRRVAKFSNWYLKAYWNEKFYDMEHNGELRLIKYWSETIGTSHDASVVFDVGAHMGEYSLRLLSLKPSAQIHCFEIVPRVREMLQIQVAKHPNIIVNEFGLSDSNGPVTVTFFPDSLTEARIHSLRKGLKHEFIECLVRRGDDYVREHGISHIDLLKIDTEGHELFVLKGFRDTLRQQKIGVIQFEYGTTFLSSRSLLSDVYDLLEPFGFTIGRLYPQGVFFKNFELLKDECFRMGNYVAVHNNWRHLIDKCNLNRHLTLTN